MIQSETEADPAAAPAPKKEAAASPAAAAPAPKAEVKAAAPAPAKAQAPEEKKKEVAPPAATKPQTKKAAASADDEDHVAKHEIKSDKEPESTFTPKDPQEESSGSLQAYIGAELYNKRMFPHGCPSYQKAFVKLYKIEKRKLKLVDVRYFNNRDGFGYLLRNLTKGDYQIQFKKYSTGFDVFDFTVKMHSDRFIKLIDDDHEEIKKITLTKEQLRKIPSIKDKEPSASNKVNVSKESAPKAPEKKPAAVPVPASSTPAPPVVKAAVKAPEAPANATKPQVAVVTPPANATKP